MAGRVLLKCFAFHRKKIKLGNLISLRFELNGHGLDFSYSVSEDTQKCEMVCKCGWRTKIESFDKPWSIIEVKHRAAEHFESFGIVLDHQVAIFKMQSE